MKGFHARIIALKSSEGVRTNYGSFRTFLVNADGSD